MQPSDDRTFDLQSCLGSIERTYALELTDQVVSYPAETLICGLPSDSAHYSMAAARSALPPDEPFPPAQLAAARELLFANLPGDDVSRWYEQGFVLNPPSSTGAADGGDVSLSFGLRQRSGGPCGMLAAVQGYMLYSLLFGDVGTDDAVTRAPLTAAREAFTSPDVRAAFSASVAAVYGSATAYARRRLNAPADTVHAALTQGLAFLLWQAATAPHRGTAAASPVTASLVIVSDVSLLPLHPGIDASGLSVLQLSSFAELQAAISAHMPLYESDSGVILILLSLLLTRGIDVVRADMDEVTPLIARFGHSSQELLNLFLTGEAVSGIFDGEKLLDAGGEDVGLTLRGVTRQPVLGYLSQIEALRYGCVGDYFKTPLVPVWVIGSESHFSLLFGCDLSVNEASPSSQVYRAFRKYDVHDNQFIAAEQLVPLLTDLGLPHVHDDSALAGLKSTLDTGTGIIVWSEFWQTISPLMESLRPQPAPVGGAVAPAAAAPAPAPSAAAPAPAVTVASLQARVQAAFNRADVHGGGFIMGNDVEGVLRAAGLTVATDPSRGPALEALLRRIRADEPPASAVVLYDDMNKKLLPTLQAQVGTAGAASAFKPPAAAATSAAAGTKRPRSDSDVARELQAQMDAEASRPSAPAPPDALPSFDLSMFGGAAPAPARSVSTTAVTGGLIHADPAPPAAPAPAPRSAYAPNGVTRMFELYHYNGLYDRSRVPRCVRLLLKQSDSGLPPVAAHSDAVSASAVAMSIEDETAAAIAASALEAGNEEDAALAAALAASTQEAGGTGAAPSAAAVPTGATRARSAALEAILRTKWPGVVLTCDGAPPSID